MKRDRIKTLYLNRSTRDSYTRYGGHTDITCLHVIQCANVVWPDLDANGSRLQVIKADTILRGVFSYTDSAAPPAWVASLSPAAGDEQTVLRRPAGHDTARSVYTAGHT